jgi:hypothetical protein
VEQQRKIKFSEDVKDQAYKMHLDRWTHEQIAIHFGATSRYTVKDWISTRKIKLGYISNMNKKKKDLFKKSNFDFDNMSKKKERIGFVKKLEFERDLAVAENEVLKKI